MHLGATVQLEWKPVDLFWGWICTESTVFYFDVSTHKYLFFFLNKACTLHKIKKMLSTSENIHLLIWGRTNMLPTPDNYSRWMLPKVKIGSKSFSNDLSVHRACDVHRSSKQTNNTLLIRTLKIHKDPPFSPSHRGWD